MRNVLIPLLALLMATALLLAGCDKSTATSADAQELQSQATEVVETVEQKVADASESVAAESKSVDKRVVKPDVSTMKKNAVSEPAQAKSTRRFQEGTHYITIDRRVNTGVPTNKIAVQEMFWYGCPHCASLDPVTQQWKKGVASDVEFQYIPAALNPNWATHARAFYAAEQLGLLELTHENLFKAIHQQNRRIQTEDALVRFFSAAGANPDEFRAAMHNDYTDKKVNLSASLAKRYGLTGVPSLIVDGQYRVLLHDGLKSYQELYEIVDYLVEKVRQDRSNG